MKFVVAFLMSAYLSAFFCVAPCHAVTVTLPEKPGVAYRLTPTGVEKVRQAGAAMAQASGIAGKILGKLPVVGGVVTAASIGMMLYDEFGRPDSARVTPSGAGAAGASPSIAPADSSTTTDRTSGDTSGMSCTSKTYIYQVPEIGVCQTGGAWFVKSSQWSGSEGTDGCASVDWSQNRSTGSRISTTDVTLGNITRLANCTSAAGPSPVTQHRTVITYYYAPVVPYDAAVGDGGVSATPYTAEERARTNELLSDIASALQRIADNTAPASVTPAERTAITNIANSYPGGTVQLSPGDTTQDQTTPTTTQPTTTSTTLPGNSPATDPPPSTPPPTPTACGECTSTRRLDEISALNAASIPVFGLISKLVWNPSAGGVSRAYDIPLSTGNVTVDLTVWHFDILVAAIRFFVLFGAIMAAYRIIFE